MSTATLPASAYGEIALFATLSERVKSVDVHPELPWLLTARYDGSLAVFDYSTRQCLQTLRLCDSPVRATRFIPRQRWIVAGSDDRMLRVVHESTGEIVAAFKAHDDYIRAVVVHPTLPLVLSCGDDGTFKVWNWTRDWQCVRAIKAHGHYVMELALTMDVSTLKTRLATASLDGDVCLWSVDDVLLADDIAAPASRSAVLHSHSQGVNTVAFNASGTRMLSGSDDRSVKLWDLATHAVMSTFEGHTANVTTVLLHPTLPLAFSGAEDGSVRLWNTETQRCVAEWTHDLGRVWSLRLSTSRPEVVAIGFDRGAAVVELPISLVDEQPQQQ